MFIGYRADEMVFDFWRVESGRRRWDGFVAMKAR